MKKLFICGFISAFLFSCSSNDQPVTDNTIVPAGTESTVNTTTTTTGTAITSPAAPSTLPVTTATMPAGSPVTTGAVTKQNISASSQSSNAGINPAHGQPGHRCDISVGAPLNSPPGNANSTVTNMTAPAPVTRTPAASQVTTSAVTPTKTAPGMNPPHGQPGHRCDISVGEPLSSPVKKPATTTTTPAATIQSTERQDAKTITPVPQ